MDGPPSGSSDAPWTNLETVYGELRRIAVQRLRSERSGHTLQATALVHEAWVRLSQGAGLQASPTEDRARFLAHAAESMRRVLIDHARSRSREKRGGKAGPGGTAARRVPLEALELIGEDRDPTEILVLEEALCRLEELDSEAFAVVRLRFFAGLTGDEAAEVLGVSPSHVDRLWAYARAWLQRELGSPAHEDS